MANSTAAPSTARLPAARVGTSTELGRRPRDASKTRRDILVTAALKFARQGYSRVTLREIADEIGVTPALVVRYFGSKRALFEEVAQSQLGVPLPELVDGDLQPQLEMRARMILSHFADPTARAPGVALLRSLDLDDGALFRSQLERRTLEPWSKEIVGRDVDVRLWLITGLLMGVGLFTVGALTEPERPPLCPAEAELLVQYFGAMLAVCLDPQ
jgi:AcrR family transcriptional regulator